jgi:phosphoglycolate phosphatase-like HAD superfamily hydrolase
MIGDSESDIQAGKNAGCRTARLSETKQMAMEPENKAIASIDADVVASSLLDAVPQILRFRHS